MKLDAHSADCLREYSGTKTTCVYQNSSRHLRQRKDLRRASCPPVYRIRTGVVRFWPSSGVEASKAARARELMPSAPIRRASVAEVESWKWAVRWYFGCVTRRTSAFCSTATRSERGGKSIRGARSHLNIRSIKKYVPQSLSGHSDPWIWMDFPPPLPTAEIEEQKVAIIAALACFRFHIGFRQSLDYALRQQVNQCLQRPVDGQAPSSSARLDCCIPLKDRVRYMMLLRRLIEY